jgi:DNA-binding CsgD family transcriptional regulator
VKKSPQTGRDPNPANGTWLLTRREREVLGVLRTGASDKEIATALGISRSTASKHVENILKKMKGHQPDRRREFELAEVGPTGGRALRQTRIAPTEIRTFGGGAPKPTRRARVLPNP